MTLPSFLFTDLIICSLESTNTWTYYVEKLRRGGPLAAPFSLTGDYRPSVAYGLTASGGRRHDPNPCVRVVDRKGNPTPGRQRRQHVAGCSLARSAFTSFTYRGSHSSSSPRTRDDLLAKQIAPLTGRYHTVVTLQSPQVSYLFNRIIATHDSVRSSERSETSGKLKLQLRSGNEHIYARERAHTRTSLFTSFVFVRFDKKLMKFC